VHWFCFWVGDYPLSVWLLNPSIYFFPPRCGSAGDYQTYCYVVLICMSCEDCICILEFIVEICNSYVSMNVNLNRKAMYCIHLSRFVRPCEPTICWVVVFLNKLIKSLYSFFYNCLCTPGVVTRWAVYSGVWPLSCLSIYAVFCLYRFNL